LLGSSSSAGQKTIIRKTAGACQRLREHGNYSHNQTTEAPAKAPLKLASRTLLMIKVLIERVIAEGLEQPYEEAARKVIQQAVQSPGFISGESFRDLERPNHRIVMVTWQNRHSWERWENSQARIDSISAFAPMLEREERITLLEPL
jgi:heme-degrading monooxygenase HmoA|tara:strand:+ start:1266 stop:1706 length:441 start_codon:yes stop_codon:yes gene_type:complete